MPRATIAACEDLPPCEVTIPRAASKPPTSSAEVKGRTRITSAPSAARSTACAAVKTISPLAAPGRGADAAGELLEVGVRGEGRVQQRVERAGVDRPQSRRPVEQSLLDGVDREADRRARVALGAPGLEDEQPAALDRVLDVLDVAEVALERLEALEQLGVDRRHPALQPAEVLGVADAGDHVLALGGSR